MRIGDIVKMDNPRGEDFTVKILDLFEDNGIPYAEVEPVDFKSFTREVPIDRLKEVSI